MKKIFYLFALLFCVAPVFAQSDGEDDPVPPIRGKSNAFFIGPKVGGTMTTMTQPNECDLYDGSAFGYSAGLAMKARFGRAFESSAAGTGTLGFALELKYKNNSVKTIGTDESGKQNANLSINYFEVPVALQFYPLAKNYNTKNLCFEVGAAFAGTMGRSPKSLTVNQPNETYASVIYNFDTENSTLKGMDVRPFVGIGYTPTNSSFDINARYYLGTSDLAGNFPCKMSNIEVSIAWMFNAGKF